MRIGRDVKFACFLPHLSFVLLCVSCILCISKKQSGSSDSPQKSDQGITSQLTVLLKGLDRTFCFLLEHHNTCVRSHPPWRDSPVLSTFSTSLNKPSSFDCSSRPRSTGLQWVLFNFTATAPKHLTFQGVIFCSSYLTTLHH